ncbi:MAG: asparagine synthase C-terminal domain-containing protein [Pseudomonadota bacterium]
MNEQLGDFILCLSSNPERLINQCNDLRWPTVYSNSKCSPPRTIQIESFSAACIGGARLTESASGIQIGLYHLTDIAAVDLCHSSVSENLYKTSLPGLETPAGNFLTATYDRATNELTLCTDYLRSFPVYYAESAGGLTCSSDCRLLAKFLKLTDVDDLAVYHYLNFSYVPTPHTIYKNIRKLPPASVLRFNASQGALTVRHWRPKYTESLGMDEHEAEIALRTHIVEAIENLRPNGHNWGSFLSGGNDSSTVSAVLSAQDRNATVNTFSIGFSEQGYDELPYARIAAKAFSAKGFDKKVSANEAFECIGKLVDIYDEPFGNSSAIPTFFCAALAAQNDVFTLVAGDGGDEVFGGNERYAKDAIFQRFYSLPESIKKMFQVASSSLAPLDLRFINRVNNFVSRGSLPNPERFYVDDSFASDFYEDFLTKPFQSLAKRDTSLELVSQHFNECEASTDLNRLMYIDLQMAIADNDLMKVNKTAKAAGVSVFYPYLSKSLIEFTCKLPSRFKLNGTQKRYLFRKSVANILPPQILQKKKQGFGLPVSVWFREQENFRALVHDVLLSPTASQRGYFNHKFINQLVSRHDKGAWDYSAELWMLIILELWLRKNIDAI